MFHGCSRGVVLVLAALVAGCAGGTTGSGPAVKPSEIEVIHTQPHGISPGYVVKSKPAGDKQKPNRRVFAYFDPANDKQLTGWLAAWTYTTILASNGDIFMKVHDGSGMGHRQFWKKLLPDGTFTDKDIPFFTQYDPVPVFRQGRWDYFISAGDNTLRLVQSDFVRRDTDPVIPQAFQPSWFGDRLLRFRSYKGGEGLMTRDGMVIGVAPTVRFFATNRGSPCAIGNDATGRLFITDHLGIVHPAQEWVSADYVKNLYVDIHQGSQTRAQDGFIVKGRNGRYTVLTRELAIALDNLVSAEQITLDPPSSLPNRPTIDLDKRGILVQDGAGEWAVLTPLPDLRMIGRGKDRAAAIENASLARYGEWVAEMEKRRQQQAIDQANRLAYEAAQRRQQQIAAARYAAQQKQQADLLKQFNDAVAKKDRAKLMEIGPKLPGTTFATHMLKDPDAKSKELFIACSSADGELYKALLKRYLEQLGKEYPPAIVNAAAPAVSNSYGGQYISNYAQPRYDPYSVKRQMDYEIRMMNQRIDAAGR